MHPITSYSRGLAILGALALLLVATRGHHFAAIPALPSASAAVFFLAGVFSPWRWPLLALLVMAFGLDLHSVLVAGVGGWCLTPSYGFLLPAYASLFWAGRLHARGEAIPPAARMLLAMLLGATAAFLISNGSFYWLSGRYPDPYLAEYLQRVVEYYPGYIGRCALYVVPIGLLQWVAAAVQARSDAAVRSGAR